MSDARFVFLVGEGPESTVIDSQVVDAIVAVAAEGVALDLFFLPNPRPMLTEFAYYARRRREIAARIGRRVRMVPVPRRQSRIGALIGAAAVATELWRSRGVVVAHARSDGSAYLASLVAARSPRFRYLYDVRGDVEGEYRLQGAAKGSRPTRSSASSRSGSSNESA